MRRTDCGGACRAATVRRIAWFLTSVLQALPNMVMYVFLFDNLNSQSGRQEVRRVMADERGVVAVAVVTIFEFII